MNKMVNSEYLPLVTLIYIRNSTQVKLFHTLMQEEGTICNFSMYYNRIVNNNY